MRLERKPQLGAPYQCSFPCSWLTFHFLWPPCVPHSTSPPSAVRQRVPAAAVFPSLGSQNGREIRTIRHHVWRCPLQQKQARPSATGDTLPFWRISSSKGDHVLLLAASDLLLTVKILSMSYQCFSVHVKRILRPSGCSFCFLYFLFPSLAHSWIFTMSLLHFFCFGVLRGFF